MTRPRRPTLTMHEFSHLVEESLDASTLPLPPPMPTSKPQQQQQKNTSTIQRLFARSSNNLAVSPTTPSPRKIAFPWPFGKNSPQKDTQIQNNSPYSHPATIQSESTSSLGSLLPPSERIFTATEEERHFLDLSSSSAPTPTRTSFPDADAVLDISQESSIYAETVYGRDSANLRYDTYGVDMNMSSVQDSSYSHNRNQTQKKRPQPLTLVLPSHSSLAPSIPVMRPPRSASPVSCSTHPFRMASPTRISPSKIRYSTSYSNMPYGVCPPRSPQGPPIASQSSGSFYSMPSAAHSAVIGGELKSPIGVGTRLPIGGDLKLATGPTGAQSPGLPSQSSGSFYSLPSAAHSVVLGGDFKNSCPNLGLVSESSGSTYSLPSANEGYPVRTSTSASERGSATSHASTQNDGSTSQTRLTSSSQPPSSFNPGRTPASTTGRSSTSSTQRSRSGSTTRCSPPIPGPPPQCPLPAVPAECPPSSGSESGSISSASAQTSSCSGPVEDTSSRLSAQAMNARASSIIIPASARSSLTVTPLNMAGITRSVDVIVGMGSSPPGCVPLSSSTPPGSLRLPSRLRARGALPLGSSTSLGIESLPTKESGLPSPPVSPAPPSSKDKIHSTAKPEARRTKSILLLRNHATNQSSSQDCTHPNTPPPKDKSKRVQIQVSAPSLSLRPSSSRTSSTRSNPLRTSTFPPVSTPTSTSSFPVHTFIPPSSTSASAHSSSSRLSPPGSSTTTHLLPPSFSSLPSRKQTLKRRSAPLLNISRSIPLLVAGVPPRASALDTDWTLSLPFSIDAPGSGLPVVNGKGKSKSTNGVEEEDIEEEEEGEDWTLCMPIDPEKARKAKKMGATEVGVEVGEAEVDDSREGGEIDAEDVELEDSVEEGDSKNEDAEEDEDEESDKDHLLQLALVPRSRPDSRRLFAANNYDSPEHTIKDRYDTQMQLPTPRASPTPTPSVSMSSWNRVSSPIEFIRYSTSDECPSSPVESDRSSFHFSNRIKRSSSPIDPSYSPMDRSYLPLERTDSSCSYSATTSHRSSTVPDIHQAHALDTKFGGLDHDGGRGRRGSGWDVCGWFEPDSEPLHGRPITGLVAPQSGSEQRTSAYSDMTIRPTDYASSGALGLTLEGISRMSRQRYEDPWSPQHGSGSSTATFVTVTTTETSGETVFYSARSSAINPLATI
ncbi:hypothetical protein BJ138DRAFT_318340 [Hygrophoropsis aurantiaca]|uniref:Uncharacterized protein n=1 Tax=Hygrophoropsis aurantiaca TaxID=72124 RepID=A0ACB8A7V9_9AGAM|nr:hypothetical protein BJ138DRAFT_318340 [Hygrophoropsis aurantiaca]